MLFFGKTPLRLGPRLNSCFLRAQFGLGQKIYKMLVADIHSALHPCILKKNITLGWKWAFYLVFITFSTSSFMWLVAQKMQLGFRALGFLQLLYIKVQLRKARRILVIFSFISIISLSTQSLKPYVLKSLKHLRGILYPLRNSAVKNIIVWS